MNGITQGKMKALTGAGTKRSRTARISSGRNWFSTWGLGGILILLTASQAFADKVPVRLDLSTPQEVTQNFTKMMSNQIDRCFDLYKKEKESTAKTLTQRVIDSFESNYPYNGDLIDDYCAQPGEAKVVIETLFQIHNRYQVYPSELKSWIYKWALLELETMSVDGYVADQIVDTIFYDALVATMEQNANAREKNPQAFKIQDLRNQWGKISKQTKLDTSFLPPVLITEDLENDEKVVNQILSAFSYQSLKLQSKNSDAVNEFWFSSNGLQGSPLFAPVAALISNKNIRKAYFFAGGQTEPYVWSKSSLIIIDEFNQAYGFEIGYSE